MMAYRVAAVDVHKKMLAVVVADVGGEGEYQYERRKFGATPDQLHVLAQWLVQQEVEEVVMESTAPYWKPVWGALERYWKPERQKREGAPKMSGALHLCQAKSNRGPRGRKNDFAEGERMIKSLGAQELGLSFVPDAGQRAVANGDAAQAPVDPRQSALSEPTGEPVGTGAPQVIELRVGSAGRQCAADVEGAGGRGNRPGGSGGSGRLPAARHAGTTARRAGRLYGTQWSLPSDAEDGAGGVAVDGRADGAIGSGGLDPTPGASGRGATSGGSARLRSGFSGADDRRSRSRGSGVRIGEGAGFVGGDMSGERRERRRVQEYAFAEGQQHHAAVAESGSAVCGQGPRQHF